LLDSCRSGNRNSQDRVYRYFYAYAIGICLRYSRTRDEAIEILNDGYLKVFTKLDKYSKGLSFKGWLRKIMVRSAIDYFRKNEKHYHSLDVSYAQYQGDQSTETILDKLSAEEILTAVQTLPPSYRIVFNLYAIEGFKHEEIANQLNISVGTSKSNLSIARDKLKRMLIAGREYRLRKDNNG
jgi:RNA polymerase sigma factor (sigma-70 family)